MSCLVNLITQSAHANLGTALELTLTDSQSPDPTPAGCKSKSPVAQNNMDVLLFDVSFVTLLQHCNASALDTHSTRV